MLRAPPFRVKRKAQRLREQEALRELSISPDRNQPRSKRSRFITLVQAATKSWMNFSCASVQA